MLWVIVAMGLYATLSRGPLLATAAVLLLMGIFTGKAMRYYTALTGAGLLIVAGLFFSPFWDKVVRVLPFVGSVDVSNVTYRQQLFEATLMMVGQRPWFGTIHVLDHLEHLRQGQGIIDLVNTYAIYAMSYGLVGLGLFMVFLGSGIVFGIEVAVRCRKKNLDAYRAAGCTAVALLGSMIVIVAVSNIDSVPLVYTSLVAILVAMVRIERPIRNRRALARAGLQGHGTVDAQVTHGALRS
jgi:hypothetical protein